MFRALAWISASAATARSFASSVAIRALSRCRNAVAYESAILLSFRLTASRSKPRIAVGKSAEEMSSGRSCP